MHLYYTRMDFQEIYLGFFFAHSWFGKVHICVEIIFRKLYLQLCQTYEHCYHKDLFFGYGFCHPTKFISFFVYYVWITTDSIYLVETFIYLFFWAIYLPRLRFCILKHLHVLFFTLQFQNKIIPFRGGLKTFPGEAWACRKAFQLLSLLSFSSWSTIHLSRRWVFTGRAQHKNQMVWTHTCERAGFWKNFKLTARIGLPGSGEFYLPDITFWLTELPR